MTHHPTHTVTNTRTMIKMKKFQNKPTYIINSVTKEQVFEYSDSAAQITMTLAGYANDPRYHPPHDGYSKDTLLVAKWMRDKTLKRQLIRHYDRNIYLFTKRANQ